jgi:hypothetical protein
MGGTSELVRYYKTNNPTAATTAPTSPYAKPHFSPVLAAPLVDSFVDVVAAALVSRDFNSLYLVTGPSLPFNPEQLVVDVAVAVTSSSLAVAGVAKCALHSWSGSSVAHREEIEAACEEVHSGESGPPEQMAWGSITKQPVLSAASSAEDWRRCSDCVGVGVVVDTAEEPVLLLLENASRYILSTFA